MVDYIKLDLISLDSVINWQCPVTLSLTSILSPGSGSTEKRSAREVNYCGGNISPELQTIYFRIKFTGNENKFESSLKDWKPTCKDVTGR